MASKRPKPEEIVMKLQQVEIKTRQGMPWLNDGACVRLRPEYEDHVWSYDFIHCQTYDGKVFRTLNAIDEFSRECLALKGKRKLNSDGVIEL